MYFNRKVITVIFSTVCICFTRDLQNVFYSISDFEYFCYLCMIGTGITVEDVLTSFL